ncbi:tail assembly protein [Pasteurellaceae bacterium 20609_3]|uniref:tail assembly protein n=1 Tax=Spirabiliibacterium mucosae TaxID=28156 RepID=UPI001AADA8A2|nr:tail assembly protein [Spirabiliibacterium mucosae]MBE2898070.1 tail assembly protein [Spirabiliibacterium mucosae]
MVTVRFYGDLKRFGDKFELNVKDTAEAIRALIVQIPNLRQAMQRGWYKVRLGSKYLTYEGLREIYHKLKDGMTIHVTPLLKGAKSGGAFGIIAGIALIGAAFALGPLGLGLMASNTALMVGGFGASMLLGGVSQILMKPPAMPGVGDSKEKKQSTSFSNLSNLVAQGRPVPLAYGRIMVGSLVISQGLETYDVEDEIEQAANIDTGNRGIFGKGDSLF